jgi:hypothetical protein
MKQGKVRRHSIKLELPEFKDPENEGRVLNLPFRPKFVKCNYFNHRVFPSKQTRFGWIINGLPIMNKK